MFNGNQIKRERILSDVAGGHTDAISQMDRLMSKIGGETGNSEVMHQYQ